MKSSSSCCSNNSNCGKRRCNITVEDFVIFFCCCCCSYIGYFDKDRSRFKKESVESSQVVEYCSQVESSCSSFVSVSMSLTEQYAVAMILSNACCLYTEH